MKNTLLLIIGAFTIVFVIYLRNSWWAPTQPEELNSIRLHSVPAIVEITTHVAYQNKYFEQEGLNVDLTINPDGKTSLENLFAGKADIIHVMGTPVVFSSLKRNDFYIIGNIKHSKIHFIVARKDRGIKLSSDLIGKKIGVMRGTSADFFMDSYFIYNNLRPSDIKIINMNGPEMVNSIENGEIDALFCWSPFPQIAQEKLGDNALILTSDEIVSGSWVIIVMKEFAHKHPIILEKYLRALVMAEKYIRKNRLKAMEIHSKIAGVDLKVITKLSENMIFELNFEQRVISDLEDQARWVINNKYTKKTEVPNYLDMIYPDALETVKPDAVNIIW
jgi:ABC-type nitrate/sulfonate/bicarbonate transport system substrate-binding protein